MVLETEAFTIISNFGVPTFFVVMYILKVSPALDNFSSAINNLTIEISKLKEVQLSLREQIVARAAV